MITCLHAHACCRYLVDKVNGIAYTHDIANPRQIGSWDGATIVLDESKATSVHRIECNGETYLVDKGSGLVYTNDLAYPVEVGMWTGTGGITLFRKQEKTSVAKKKSATLATAVGGGGGMAEEEQRYLQGLPAVLADSTVEVNTSVLPISASVVYDDIPGLMSGEGNYQGMDPEWIDGQHQMLANFGWFREDCKNDHEATGELEDGEAGNFIVRVVQGAEMAKIGSQHHQGRPGNYAMSVCMPLLEGKSGQGAVYHFLILPSWDPTGRAAGETLYRIGASSKKLFTAIPELIRYYCAKGFHKQRFKKDPGTGKKKKAVVYRLVSTYQDPDNYADLVVTNDAPDFGFGFASSRSDAGAYMDMPANRPNPDAYMDVPTNQPKPGAYMDAPSEPGSGGGGLGTDGYMVQEPAAAAAPTSVQYMDVKPTENGGRGTAAYMTVDTQQQSAAAAYMTVGTGGAEKEGGDDDGTEAKEEEDSDDDDDESGGDDEEDWGDDSAEEC